MDALLTGTSGGTGWPQPDCRCASCMLARSGGPARQAAGVLVDGTLEFSTGSGLSPGTWPRSGPAHVIRQLPGGWDVTGPDGSRLLLSAGAGLVPEPAADARPYDIALLDVLASPAQLGRLRAAGLVHQRTAVVALFADHRIRSQAELARRCALWSAVPGRDGQLITGPVRQAGPAVRPHRTLIAGGGRSGKSTEAELRLAAEPQVTYLAAGPLAETGGGEAEPDAEWADRVARHRARRPAWWQTVEGLDLAGPLRRPGRLCSSTASAPGWPR